MHMLWSLPLRQVIRSNARDLRAEPILQWRWASKHSADLSPEPGNACCTRAAGHESGVTPGRAPSFEHWARRTIWRWSPVVNILKTRIS